MDTVTSTAAMDLPAQVQYYANLVNQLILALCASVTLLTGAVIVFRSRATALWNALTAMAASVQPMLAAQDEKTCAETKRKMKQKTSEFGAVAAEICEEVAHEVQGKPNPRITGGDA